MNQIERRIRLYILNDFITIYRHIAHAVAQRKKNEEQKKKRQTKRWNKLIKLFHDWRNMPSSWYHWMNIHFWLRPINFCLRHTQMLNSIFIIIYLLPNHDIFIPYKKKKQHRESKPIKYARRHASDIRYASLFEIKIVWNKTLLMLWQFASFFPHHQSNWCNMCL